MKRTPDQPTGRSRTFSLDEVVVYGGEEVTVAAMIEHLQSVAPDQGCVDRYLQGFFYTRGSGDGRTSPEAL